MIVIEIIGAHNSEVHMNTPIRKELSKLFEDFTGKLVMDEYLPAGNLEKFNWLFSGVPVLWDNLSQKEIYKRILAEAADHSHVFCLPRGNHPEKTEETTAIRIVTLLWISFGNDP